MRDRNRLARVALVAILLILSWLTPASADVKRQKFGNWTKECLVSGSKRARCHIAQTLVDKKGRKIVYFIVSRNDSGPYLEVSAPLGLYIPAGVAVRIDKDKGTSMELIDCNRVGCRAVLPLNSKTVNQLKIGKNIAVDFVDSKSGKKLSVKGSLNGFFAAAKSFGL